MLHYPLFKFTLVTKLTYHDLSYSYRPTAIILGRSKTDLKMIVKGKEYDIRFL